MGGFASDIRYGLRGLKKNPGFAAVAVSTLALGIGATVAIFAVVDAVLLKPLPYPQPDRLVRVGQLHPVKNASGVGASYKDYRDMVERSRAFEKLAAILESSVVLGGTESAARVDAGWVSAEMFAALRIEPLAGRVFRPEEDREGGNTHVALVSEGFWKTRFAGDRSILGRKILAEGIPYEVIGVFRDDTVFLENLKVLLPLVNQAFPARSGRALDVVGRMGPGVTLARARAEMASIGRALAAEYPEENGGFSVVVVPLQESMFGSRRPALLVLSAAVSLLLLIACANTANLLLARGALRRQELAVRAALGAGQGRLARQLLAEGCSLALLGGFAGVVFAGVLLDVIRRFAAGSVPRVETAALDGRVLLFAALASFLTVFLFALLPAALGSRRAIAEGLRPGRGSSVERSRVLDGLIVVQTALSLVLLVGAGLLGGSYARLSRTDPGFSPERVLSLQISLPRGVFREPEKRTVLFERMIGRIALLPGVRSAGLIGWLPSQASMTMSFSPEGHPKLSRAQSPQAEIREVSEGTFTTLGIPLLAGRGIAGRDRADAPPVIVVNRQLAQKLWPGKPAVGRHITLFADNVAREVVGVVGDVRRMDRAAQTTDQVYVSFAQDPLFIRMSAVVRASGEPAALATSIEKTIREVDARVAVSDVKTMRQVLSGSVAEPRFRTILLGFFAAAALLLASIGLYGVIAYTVTRRRYEIGVRIALGATPAEILRLFIRGGLRLAGWGALAGIPAALAATRGLKGLLYGVGAADPATFAAAAALLIAVALVASFFPARRASTTDPLVALKTE